MEETTEGPLSAALRRHRKLRQEENCAESLTQFHETRYPNVEVYTANRSRRANTTNDNAIIETSEQEEDIQPLNMRQEDLPDENF